MYTDEQKRRHIYDLQVCLRRIQQENDHPQPLVPDGIFGAETAEAVRAHQRQNGLPVSGQVDRATWDSIFDAYKQLTALDALPAAVRFFPAEGGVLSPGDRGAAVFVLQLLLGSGAPHFANLAPVPLTGEYDAETETAVRVMQGIFGLPPTGVADCATWDMLGRSAQRALRARAPRVGAALSGYKTATDRKSLP